MNKYLEALLTRYPPLKTCQEDIGEAFAVLEATFTAKGKLLLCGNGGSAADSDHMAAELLKGFGHSRPLGKTWQEKLGDDLAARLQGALPVIPLPVFTSLITAFANDCNPVYIFAQLTWALGNPGDTLLCISTSGNSENILHAADVARSKGLKTIGLTGQRGGALKDRVACCIRVPETEVYKVQEYHLPVYHCLSFMLEDTFFPEGSP